MAVGALALVVAGCSGDADPEQPDDSETTTSGPTSPATEPSPPSEPTEVGLPEHEGFDWRIAIAPDGLTALIARSDGFFPQTRESTIYEITRQPDGGWGDPVVAPFSGEGSADIDPVFNLSGSRVFFSSIRPVDGVAREDVEIWSVDRLPDAAWTEPVHVPELGSPGDDLYPSLGPDGSVYLGSDRGGAGFDIWVAQAQPDGTIAAPVVLPEPITTTQWEFNPVIAPDGTTLVLTAQGRAGGSGAGDLFVSRRTGDAWSEPEPLPVVNTSADEYHPAFSPDGASFYFVREGTLYEVAASAVGLG